MAMVVPSSDSVVSVVTCAGAGETLTAPGSDFGSSGLLNAIAGSPLTNRLPAEVSGVGVGSIANAEYVRTAPEKSRRVARLPYCGATPGAISSAYLRPTLRFDAGVRS